MRRRVDRKNIQALGLVAVMLFGMASCSGAGPDTAGSETSSDTTPPAEQPAPVTTESPTSAGNDEVEETQKDHQAATPVTEPTPTAQAGGSVVLDFSQQLVTFAPVPPRPEGNDIPLPDGSVDYWLLFEDPSSWSAAMENLDAFKIHSWMVRHYFTDEQLVLISDFLVAHEIGLILEAEPLDPPDLTRCQHGESFEGPYELENLERMRSLGVKISAIAVEQPMSYGTLSTEAGRCRYPLDETLDQTTDWIKSARAIYPGVPVGSIEAVWRWSETDPADFEAWWDGWEERLGEPPAFQNIDFDATLPDWAENALLIERAAEARGIPFGLLYTGYPYITNSDEWMLSLMRYMSAYQVELGGTPEQIHIASWFEVPRFVLPEDSIAAYTHLINRALGVRTKFDDPTIDLGETATVVSGRVVDEKGGPVEGLNVSVSAMPIEGAVQTIEVTGTVPDDVTEALVVLRVNYEEDASGAFTARIDSVGLSQSGTGNLVPDAGFDGRPDGWYLPDDAAAQIVPSDFGDGGGMLALAVDDDLIGIDGTPFAVTPGGDFVLSARIGVVDLNPAGLLSVIMLRNGKEIIRMSLPIQAQQQLLGTATTDAQGNYSVEVPFGLMSGEVVLEVDTVGDINTWPATLTTTVTFPS